MRDIAYHKDRIDPVLDKICVKVYGKHIYERATTGKFLKVNNSTKDVAGTIKLISATIFPHEPMMGRTMRE